MCTTVKKRNKTLYCSVYQYKKANYICILLFNGLGDKS